MISNKHNPKTLVDIVVEHEIKEEEERRSEEWLRENERRGTTGENSNKSFTDIFNH